MKRLITAAATAAMALGGTVAIAAPAQAAGTCLVAKSSTSITVGCQASNPGTEFRLVIDCNSGRKWSRWETQGGNRTITMNCAAGGLRLADIQYR